MNKTLKAGLVLLIFSPVMAFAHTGGGQTSGFQHGILHPISGIDHLLAMIAVGLWASQLGGRAYWAVPSTFVVAMILGGMIGFSGVFIPFTEEGILVSILVLGLFIATTFKLSTNTSMVAVGLFAVFHGYAHGVEIEPSVSTLPFTAGFALVTMVIHLFGIGLGLAMQRTNLVLFVRWLGGAIALSGIYLAVS
ncbi:HupE/UreJ family protein [Teredinibacter turnerae]|uniref:HupE/UreJ family protein n=1 Tax=Teredinibacter turnerae TaxID=2426 RepID=UPI0030CD2FB5